MNVIAHWHLYWCIKQERYFSNILTRNTEYANTVYAIIILTDQSLLRVDLIQEAKLSLG